MNVKDFFRLASNKVIMHTSWYHRYWGGVIKFWNSNQFNLDCINLGSNSGLYGFNYSQIEGIKAANWALGPQSLVHDYNILKNFFSYLKEDGIVFIPICPFSCLFSTYSKQSNLKYYTILHPATIINFNENDRTTALSTMYYPFKAMPWYCIKQTMKEAFKKIIPSKKRTIDFDGDSRKMVDMWKKQFGISDLDAPLSLHHSQEQALRAATLHDIICFCKDRRLKPIVVLLPMHTTLAQHFSNSFRQHYIYDFIEKADIKDTPFVDGFKEANYTSDDFCSSYFLNKQGSNKFTKQLCNRFLLKV